MTGTNINGVAWEDLAVLLAAMEHGSLNQVAKVLQVGQSTASRRLMRLEATLGARLFDRMPDGLKPTQFAIDLFPHAQLIESHMADIERLAFDQDQAPKGRIRLALPDGLASAWLVPELHSFFDAYPGVDVDLIIGHALVDLVRREADMALRFVPPTAPDLVVKHLGALPMGAFVHPRLAQTPAKALRWAMFVDPQALYLETQWVRTHIEPQRTMQVSLWNALFAALTSRLAAGIVSPLVARPAGLVPVAGSFPPVPSRDVYLVYHRALRRVPRFVAFRAWLLAQIDALFARGVVADAPASPRVRDG